MTLTLQKVETAMKKAMDPALFLLVHRKQNGAASGLKVTQTQVNRKCFFILATQSGLLSVTPRIKHVIAFFKKKKPGASDCKWIYFYKKINIQKGLFHSTVILKLS